MKMKDFEEIKKQMAEGTAGKSKYNLRSETQQSKDNVGRVQQLKREKRKRSKLCIIKEIALPFNPATGESDDNYNVDSKFRLEYSATTSMLMIKKLSQEYPKLKERLVRDSSLEVWDNADCEHLTDDDRKIFAAYVVPRVYTFQQIKVNIPAMGTGQFGSDYNVKVSVDPTTGAWIGEKPLFMRAYKLFSALAQEKCSELQRQKDAGEIDMLENDFKEKLSNIRRAVPVSTWHPTNFVQLIELPLNTESEIDESFFKSITPTNIGGQFRYTKMSKDYGYEPLLKRYLSGELRKLDTHDDYWELDMICPTDADRPADVGQKTNYEKPTEQIESRGDFDTKVTNFLDGLQDIERQMLISVFARRYDEETEKEMMYALPTVISLDDKYMTESVLKANKDLLIELFGSKAEELIDLAEEGLTDRDKGEYDPTTELLEEQRDREIELSVDSLLEDASDSAFAVNN